MNENSDKLFQRLFKQCSTKQIGQLLGLIVCAAGVSAVDLILVVLLAQLVDALISGGGFPIRNLVVSVIALAWLASLARAGVNLWQNRLIYRIWKSFHNTLLSKLLYQPYAFHLHHDRSELSTRLQMQLSQLRNNTLKPLIEAVSSGVTVIMLSSGLLFLAGKGSLLVLLVVLIGYGLQVLLLKPVLQSQRRAVTQAELESNNLILDSFENIRRLLLEGGQKTVLSRQKNLISAIVNNASWSGVLPHLPRQLVEPLGLSVVLLLLQIPTIRSNGSAALPWLALVTLGLLRLSQPMQNLSESYSRLQAGRPLLGDLLPLLELPIRVPNWKNLRQMHWEKLYLEGISQYYSNSKTWTLQKLNLVLERGEIVALVGASGSGKSTLASILLGLLNPDSGKVLIDDSPLTLDRITAWQRQCSEVSQPPKLQKGTVRMNLGGWSEPAAAAELLQALEQVGLREQVERLPQGLDSRVGDDGRGWSGGEQQRLALAAALLRKPGLIVLDEATSGVQEALAENLIQTLKNQPQKPAVVVISHREAVMRTCERVVVLKQGVIVADAPFADLKNNCRELRALLAQTNELQTSINT